MIWLALYLLLGEIVVVETIDPSTADFLKEKLEDNLLPFQLPESSVIACLAATILIIVLIWPLVIIMAAWAAWKDAQ